MEIEKRGIRRRPTALTIRDGLRGTAGPSSFARVIGKPLPLVFCVALSSAIASCGGAGAESTGVGDLLRPISAKRPGNAVTRSQILEVQPGTTGPFLSRGNSGGLLVWVTEDEGTGGFWTGVLNQTGGVEGEPRRIAESPPGVELVQVGPVLEDRVVVVFSTQADERAVWTIGIGTGGELRSPPQQITEAPNEVLWLDSVRLASDTLVFWAERGAGSAQLYSMLVDAGGKPKTEVTRMHGAATSWQVRPHAGGALLALVNDQRQVALIAVDEEARVQSERVLEDSDGAHNDLDLAPSRNDWVVAFSQQRPIQHHVVSAVLDPDLRVKRSVDFALPPFGEQRLERLVEAPQGDDKPAYAVWQNTSTDAGQLRVAPLNWDGKVETQPLLIPQDSQKSPPEFAATADSFHALLWSCPVKLNCSEPQLPTLLTFNGKLEPTGIAAWSHAEQPPDLAWGLNCTDGDCLSLAATFSSPPNVQVLSSRNQGKWVMPAFKPEHTWPAATSAQAVARTDKLADFEVITSDAGSLIATLSDFDPNTPYVKPKTPAPDGRLAPVRAVLRLRWMPTDASKPLREEAPSPQVISYRARSVSGASLSKRGSQVLLAWTALDRDQAQVFTTLLDARGNKLSQRMLTRKPGEVYGLRTTAIDDGFMLAWVDERRGRPEAYVAKIGPTLNRISQDTRLGEAEAEATGADVALVGKQIWAARTQADGRIFVSRMNAKSLAVEGDELAVASGRGAREPRFVVTGDSVLLAWLADDPVPGLHYLKFTIGADAASGSVTSLRAARAEHFALYYDGKHAEAVVSSEGQLLQGRLENGGALKRVLDSSTPLPVSFLGKELWYYERSGAGPHLNRAQLESFPN